MTPTKTAKSPPEVQQILDQLDYHQSEIDKIYHPYNQNHNLTTADTLRRTPKEQEQAKIDYHRREINRLYQEIRQRDPLAAAGTRVPTINVNTAAQLLQNSTTTALLNFFSTKENTYIFIIRHNRQSKELRVDLHTLTDQGITNFHNWIFEEWIVKSKYNRQQWETNAQNFLTELSQKLQINHLITNHLQGITELILIPHLYLHQIPFIALLIDPSITLLPEREGVRANYLGDHFTLRYAPSCQVLQFCQARDHIPEPLTYGLVAGASRDVPYANFQGSEITKLCKIPSTKQLNGISQTTKTAYKQLLHQANIFHAYHHANFDFAEPLNASLTVADGDILLAQILTWRLPNLSDIFLSCCETGLGLSQKLTDDIFTIASGFLCVGARNVFSTLWSVEQLSAALICVLYYRDRSENPHHRKAQSLQIAQTQLREMTGEQLETEFADALQQSIHDYINQLRDYALSLPEGTAERNTANQNLKQSQSLEIYLYTLCSKDHPFENPTYWAAFTCQGLG